MKKFLNKSISNYTFLFFVILSNTCAVHSCCKKNKDKDNKVSPTQTPALAYPTRIEGDAAGQIAPEETESEKKVRQEKLQQQNVRLRQQMWKIYEEEKKKREEKLRKYNEQIEEQNRNKKIQQQQKEIAEKERYQNAMKKYTEGKGPRPQTPEKDGISITIEEHFNVCVNRDITKNISIKDKRGNILLSIPQLYKDRIIDHSETFYVDDIPFFVFIPKDITKEIQITSFKKTIYIQ